VTCCGLAGHFGAHNAALLLVFVVESSSTSDAQNITSDCTHQQQLPQLIKDPQPTEQLPEQIEHKSKAPERTKNGHLTLANHKKRTILRTRHLPTESTYINVDYYDPRSKQASASLIPT
jgi:hypothetical protein